MLSGLHFCIYCVVHVSVYICVYITAIMCQYYIYSYIYIYIYIYICTYILFLSHVHTSTPNHTPKHKTKKSMPGQILSYLRDGMPQTIAYLKRQKNTNRRLVKFGSFCGTECRKPSFIRCRCHPFACRMTERRTPQLWDSICIWKALPRRNFQVRGYVCMSGIVYVCAWFRVWVLSAPGWI